ncbi:MAG: hypothetical protein H0S79_16270 [Anaerolineaceae bacterium]|nr:hypothetical protein [Anaerolineaceae bacterium]
MRNRILGGVIGGLVILIFALSIVFLMNSLSPEFSAGEVGLIGLAPALLAPMAGGFLAGLLAKEKAQQAGWIAGGLAGVVILVVWVILMGFSLQAILRGIVLCLVIAMVARAFAGFAKPK